jgi:hypothetical protein
MKSLYLLPALLSATIAPPALAGMGEPNTVPTSVDSSNIPATPTTTVTEIIPNLTSTSPINQQAGIINNSGSYGGSLTIPSCSGLCVFGIGRTVRNGNSDPSFEAMVGAVWQISSPENTYAQNARILAETQQAIVNNQTNLTLTKELSEAIEKKQFSRVNAIAIILAKRVGYSDFRKYLADVFNIQTITSTIDVPVNY